MCCRTSCCLGSPATQFGLLQSQIAHTQAVFRGFTSPFIVPLQFSAFTFRPFVFY